MALDLPTRALYELGDRIRLVRDQKGVSQEKLAKKIKLDRSYIGRVERGEQNITFKNLCKIASYFEKDVGYFTKDLPKPPRKGVRYSLSIWKRKRAEENLAKLKKWDSLIWP